MSEQNESQWTDNNNLQPLEFEEVESPGPVRGDDNLPPLKQRAIYKARLNQEGEDEIEPEQTYITFDLHYGDNVSQEQVDQLTGKAIESDEKDRLHVYCQVSPHVNVEEPEEEDDEQVEEEGLPEEALSEIHEDAIVIRLRVRDREVCPCVLHLDIDPRINTGDHPHWYTLGEETRVRNADITCSDGKVQVSLFPGGTNEAEFGAPVSLVTGSRSPDLRITALEDGSRYRITGSIDIS